MQLPLMLIVSALMISLVAWKEDRFAQSKSASSDTLPKKSEKKIKNLDEVLEDLDKAQLELEHSLKNMQLPPFDAQKLQAQLDKAMKEIDVEKLQEQVQKAMKQIDLEKIKVQMETLKEINTEEIKESVAKAMKDLDVQKLKMQADAELAKVDMKKVKEQLEEMKKTDFTKIEKEMKELKPKLDAELGKAKLEIEKAKTELKEYKAFEDGLQQDGLINKDEGYTIEHKDGELIINGKAQPEAVYNKYKKFLDKHKKFKLKKDDDDFDLDVN
jgi:hypothetical protein